MRKVTFTARINRVKIKVKSRVEQLVFGKNVEI